MDERDSSTDDASAPLPALFTFRREETEDGGERREPSLHRVSGTALEEEAGDGSGLCRTGLREDGRKLKLKVKRSEEAPSSLPRCRLKLHRGPNVF